MCLSPINIINPSKFISTHYRDRFLMQVPCGHCAECQRIMSNQWYYRSYYEFCDCLKSGFLNNFIYFDTLTYSNEYLPHVSDFLKLPIGCDDYPCFNRLHLHKFFDNLSKKLKRRYDTSFRYFLTSEYGMQPRDGKTYRPHYHVLFYVYGKIEPLKFSSLVAELWCYGRTDGISYRSPYYVTSHNVFTSDDTRGSMLRTCSYVSKYVQKSCLFDSELGRRVYKVIDTIAIDEYGDDADKWLASEDCRRLRLKMKRQCNLFHLQSQHFGESALSDIDLNELFDRGCLYMPSTTSVVASVPLPTYYKRKLFYELVEVDGAKYWQLNELGLQFKAARKQKLLDMVKTRYDMVCLDNNIRDIDTQALAEYVLDRRGRFFADDESLTLEERLKHLTHYGYLTCTDKAEFGKRFISFDYLGSAQVGYDTYIYNDGMPIRDFIATNVFKDDDLEASLDKMQTLIAKNNKPKDDVFSLKERLRNVYKLLIC